MGFFDKLVKLLDEDKLAELRAPNLGDLNLDEAAELLRVARSNYELGNTLSDIQIPKDWRSTFSGNCEQTIEQLLTRMQAYGPETQNLSQERAHIVSTAEDVKDQSLTIRPYVRVDEEMIHARLRELDETKQELTGLVSEAKAQQAALRTHSADEASSELSVKYNAEAKDHNDSAGNYLKGVAVAGVALAAAILFAFIIFPPGSSGDTGAEKWIAFTRGVLARTLLVGVLGIAVSFTLRNFRVNKHLATLNRRRYNALETFGLLQASVATDEARNIIIAELVHSTFQSEETGYLGGESGRTVIESPNGLAGAVASFSKMKE